MTTMFRGKTPESWCCVDCGVNTTPGHPNRKELEGLYKLTGKETPVYAATFNDRCEIYTVRDTVWKAAGMWAAASASAVLRSVSAGACGRRTLRAIHSTRCPGPSA